MPCLLEDWQVRGMGGEQMHAQPSPTRLSEMSTTSSAACNSLLIAALPLPADKATGHRNHSGGVCRCRCSHSQLPAHTAWQPTRLARIWPQPLAGRRCQGLANHEWQPCTASPRCAAPWSCTDILCGECYKLPDNTETVATDG